MAIAKIILNGTTQMDVTGKTVTANSMLNGATALKNDGTDITGNIASKTSADLTANNLTVTAPAGHYASAASKTLSDANLVAGNIKKDVQIFGVTGSYEGGGGSGKNIQYVMGRYEVAATAYTATDLSIKVSKAGSYKVYWSMDRNTTSGTNGSQLYNNGSAVGSAHTTWTHNGASCEETLTFAVNDTIVVRARSRNTSYYVGVSNLIIIEQ